MASRRDHRPPLVIDHTRKAGSGRGSQSGLSVSGAGVWLSGDVTHWRAAERSAEVRLQPGEDVAGFFFAEARRLYPALRGYRQEWGGLETRRLHGDEAHVEALFERMLMRSLDRQLDDSVGLVSYRATVQGRYLELLPLDHPRRDQVKPRIRAMNELARLDWSALAQVGLTPLAATVSYGRRWPSPAEAAMHLERLLAALWRRAAHHPHAFLAAGVGFEPPRRRPGLYALAAATARDPKEVAPATEPALIRAALAGSPLSARILTLCLNRLRAEGTAGFTRPRLALIKLTLNRLRRLASFKEEPLMPESLAPDLNDRAYQLGRLFALYAQIQWHALGEVNAGIVDKFYSTASANPARVFPYLDKLAATHLRKVCDGRPAKAVWLERQLDQIYRELDQVGDAPALHRLPLRLGAEAQGAFVIGFHQQRAALRQKRSGGAIGQTQPLETQDEIEEE